MASCPVFVFLCVYVFQLALCSCVMLVCLLFCSQPSSPMSTPVSKVAELKKLKTGRQERQVLGAELSSLGVSDFHSYTGSLMSDLISLLVQLSAYQLFSQVIV